jgi:sulfide dehydrogenase [flavocytochrome c] flavoprotein subunit
MSNFSRRDFLKAIGAAGVVSGFGVLSFPNIALANVKGKVVIIGGGFGGATCANYIKRYAPGIDVTLIEPSKQFVTCPFSNTVIGGLKTMDYITHSYDDLKNKQKVNIVHDTVTAIDGGGKKITLKSGKTLSYDQLVVSPGVSFNWKAIEGYDEKVAQKIPHAWKAGEQTLLLRKQLESMSDGGLYIISVPKRPFRAPPAPYERASLVANYFMESKPKSKIIILDANDSTDEVELFKKAWKKTYNDMIEWVGGAEVQKVDSGAMSVQTRSGDKYKGDVINIVPPQKAGHIAQNSGLADKSGWCKVNQHTFESVKMKKVHIIGDSCIAGDMLKTGHSASSQAKVCAAAIVSSMSGTQMPDPVLNSSIYSFITPKYATSSAGVYRIKGDKLTRVSGGHSPDNPKRKTQQKEAKFANGWYKGITSEMFAK